MLQHHEEEIASIELIPSGGGCFEVTVNGSLLYSKLATGRHIEPAEGLGLVGNYLRKGKP